MTKQTRREFLENSMFATLAAAAGNAGIGQLTYAAEEEGSSSPNERLRVAVLGVHNRGRSHMRGFMPRKDCEIAAIVDPDETIGVFDDEGLAGGIVYYGHRRVEILPRPPQVDAFFESGGRLMVLERWKIYWLDEVGRFEVLDSRREGRRELAVVRRTRRVTQASP